MAEQLNPSLPSIAKLKHSTALNRTTLEKELFRFCDQDNRMSYKPARAHQIALMREGAKVLRMLLGAVDSMRVSAVSKSILKAALIALSQIVPAGVKHCHRL